MQLNFSCSPCQLALGQGLAPPACHNLLNSAPGTRSKRQMLDEPNYCWIVPCKNHLFHQREYPYFRHRIPLARTDALAPPPLLSGRFTVLCDECGETYTYTALEVWRSEQELPESFTPHPLFQACPKTPPCPLP